VSASKDGTNQTIDVSVTGIDPFVRSVYFWVYDAAGQLIGSADVVTSLAAGQSEASVKAPFDSTVFSQANRVIVVLRKYSVSPTDPEQWMQYRLMHRITL